MSRVRGKPARPVLRGLRRSNAPELPDKATRMAKGDSRFAVLGLQCPEVVGEHRRTAARLG